MIQFICHPGCSTCKKARQWLDNRGISYHVRDIRLENPTREELFRWQEMSGMPVKKFFNTSGQLYRSLELKERLPGMSEEEQLALLASDGMLVRRPVLVLDGRVLLGFREEEWRKALKESEQ